MQLTATTNSLTFSSKLINEHMISMGLKSQSALLDSTDLLWERKFSGKNEGPLKNNIITLQYPRRGYKQIPTLGCPGRSLSKYVAM
jgi:hypothetical protein